MSDQIFMLGEDGELKEMSQQPYDSEYVLQELLEKYPMLLAGDQIDSGAPRRWLLIKREMGIPSEEDGGDRWSLDHFFVDQDGIPTLVEAKLSSNPEARRKVVAQMLDYAANAVVHWPVETIISEFKATCVGQKKDPDDVLDEFLGGELDSLAFWDKVKTNLQAERIRLLFVADEIAPELRRIIEFLNGQMDPAQVLGFEIRQFVGEGVRTLVPRVIGQTTEAERRKSVGGQPRRKWDEKSFFEELRDKNSESIVGVFEQLFDWAKAHLSHLKWGSGKITGSLTAGVTRGDVTWSIISLYTNGILYINLGYLKSQPVFEDVSLRQELLNKLNSIGKINFPEDKIDGYPKIEIEALSDGDNLKEFIDVMSWVVARIDAFPEDELS